MTRASGQLAVNSWYREGIRERIVQAHAEWLNKVGSLLRPVGPTLTRIEAQYVAWPLTHRQGREFVHAFISFVLKWM